jgi:hypothetical protein
LILDKNIVLSSGKVYFLCPDVPHATGGVAKIYEFASALKNAGQEAVVVHQDPQYRPNWFATDVPITGRQNTVVEADDLLVVPEFMSTLLPQLRSCAKVVLNQNSFAHGAIWFQDELVCSIVSTSQYIHRYIQFVHPQIASMPIQLGYDKSVFNATDALKKKQVAYMPRRRGEDAKRILQALERRGALEGWTVVAIDALPAQEVARVLRESMIFLSFSQREGFGLPPLEAMACGCLVIGFHGLGGAEFFDPAYCYPIPEDDICTFQETLEVLLTDPEIDSLCKVKGHAAAKAISGKYAIERQDADAVAAFSQSLLLAKEMTGRCAVDLGRIDFEPSRFRASAWHLKNAITSLV